MFSVALAVGSRRPGITWHPDPLEPGLSSPPLTTARKTVRPYKPAIVEERLSDQLLMTVILCDIVTRTHLKMSMFDIT